MKIRINADDFGISPGVNDAIIAMYRDKKLHSASLILGCGYDNEAIKLSKLNPNLKVGLHLNLTSGKATSSKSSFLVDCNQRFKYGFVSLLLLSLFRRAQFVKAVRSEIEAQIVALEKAGITISHLDGHRHIHVIPAVFEVVTELASKYLIDNVRVINEDFFTTWKIRHQKSFLFDGGIIKFLVLKFLSLFNKTSNCSEYFFSVLYSCTISKSLISKIKVPQQYDALEIMIHPGDPEKDSGLLLEEKKHLVSNKRNQECL